MRGTTHNGDEGPRSKARQGDTITAQRDAAPAPLPIYARSVEDELADVRREAERRAFDAGLARLRASFPVEAPGTCRDCGSSCPLALRRCYSCQAEWEQAVADRDEAERDEGDEQEDE